MAFFKSSVWLTISDNYAVIKKHLRTFYGEVSESTAENIVPREPELGTINGTINGTKTPSPADSFMSCRMPEVSNAFPSMRSPWKNKEGRSVRVEI